MAWFTTCEFCNYRTEKQTRREAVQAGHDHVPECPYAHDEWSFRIRQRAYYLPVRNPVTVEAKEELRVLLRYANQLGYRASAAVISELIGENRGR